MPTTSELFEAYQHERPRYSNDSAAIHAVALRYGLKEPGVRRRVNEARKRAGQGQPENVIDLQDHLTFPDKKVSKRTYDTVLRQIRTSIDYHAEKSASQDEATWIPRPEYPDLPIALVWSPDVHFGGLDVDYDFLEHHQSIIRETPNVYVAFGGDMIDSFNAIKHASAIWGDGVTPEDQMIAWADNLARLDKAHKLAALVWGNHDEFSAMAGINPFSAFFGDVSCPLFIDGGGVLNVKVGTQRYRLGLRHTFWGVSKLNQTNAPKRMIQFWRAGLDAAFTGHVHVAAGEDFHFAGEQRIACVGGTYKLRDGYAKRWYGDPQPGGFTLLMYPDRKHMQLCRYPDDARDVILGRIALQAQAAQERAA
jgi:hypothetical protein